MKIYRPYGRCNISGERVREARERADLSQERLAYKIQIAGLDITQKAISRIETGDINSRVLQTYEQDDRDIAGAKLKTILKICVALECRLEDIVTDKETLTLIAAYKG